MNKTFYPYFDVPDIHDNEAAGQSIYYPAMLFDFEKGEFVTTGAGRMVYSTEEEAFKQWCIKMLKTERGSYLSYSDDLGIELDQATKAGTREAIISEIERTITEALSVHERTESVTDFNVEFSGDVIRIKFIVEAEKIGKIPIEARIEGGH